MRLFIAVDVTEEVRAAIAEKTARLREANCDVGWVKPENFHLTLKFLGETPDGRLDDIKTALDLVSLSRAAFELELRGMGCFPERGAPRVVWVGGGAGRDALTAVARDVEGAMEDLGFPRERREFAAHLTIGRVRSPRGAERLRRLVEAEADTGFGRCVVDEIRLYKSTLASGGSIYDLLHAAKLGM
ncbi:MAG: RNA 2',3'-cyclic phosphodiesterase [Verrucomicrobia bacterium]|nr:RNA 2',3'-cyclic phosphodiesterase [Verrucomicrobiota bacterium]